MKITRKIDLSDAKYTLEDIPHSVINFLDIATSEYIHRHKMMFGKDVGEFCGKLTTILSHEKQEL